ncbi:antifungal protein-domain-containing protein [Penicillium sp. IBT 31633x]|nr:antifungal protein-domain-containing protein [Penicillium sp. IBT 31633x]
MQITTIALFFFAAMGAVANPIASEASIASEANELDARAEAGTLISYSGKCYKSKNECKFKGQNGKTTFVKCPKFANKKCTKDGASCKYDSYDGKVTCN